MVQSVTTGTVLTRKAGYNTADGPSIVWDAAFSAGGVITSYSIHYTKLYDSIQVPRLVPLSEAMTGMSTACLISRMRSRYSSGPRWKSSGEVV